MDPVILEFSGRGLHRYESIGPGVTRIGRALDNDIILSDPTVAPHHFKIISHADGTIELINLAAVNPTRVNNQPIDSLAVRELPLRIDLGRVQAKLLPCNYPVPPTRPLAGNGSGRHLFGHAGWALLLVMLCLLAGGLDFFFNSFNSFKWLDLLKSLLRETILSIGSLVLALAVLERLLVNRWDIRQLLTTICLVYLLSVLVALLADGLDYLLSASWPSTWLYFGWYLAVIPGAIALYLIHISHLTRTRSLMLALLIASPIAVPSILQSPQTQMLFDNFDSSANYHHKLSYLNWHLRDSVDIERFIQQARELEPGKAAD